MYRLADVEEFEAAQLHHACASEADSMTGLRAGSISQSQAPLKNKAGGRGHDLRSEDTSSKDNRAGAPSSKRD